MKDDVLQMDLFDETVCEVASGQLRYVLRRNPQRVADLAATRRDKQACVARLMAERNTYLAEHPRAWVSTACNKVRDKIKRLRVEAWLGVEADGRVLHLCVNEDALSEAARLDGCYVIKTDLPADAIDKEAVHDRYKDLAEVERTFRTCKTGHLEVRPVYVRTEDSTRGHVLVVMLAYLIVRALRRAWAPLDLTVEEGLAQLATLTTTEMTVARHGTKVHKIPTPRAVSAQLLEAAEVRLPEVLPNRGARVVTRRKLPPRRTNP